MYCEQEDKIIEREFLKYGLKPYIEDERIKRTDRETIQDSVKWIAVEEIDKAIIKIINHIGKALREKEIELTIREDIKVKAKADWLDKCILLKPEGRIEIEVGCQLTDRKIWEFTKVLLDCQEVYYTQVHNKKYHTRISDSDEARRTFKIIFEEAKKIK